MKRQLRRRVVLFGVTLTLLLINAFTLIHNSNIHPTEATGTIYIKADGSIDPPSANISTSDYILYTFTDDNSYEIVVQRDNVMIDGMGYTLQGSGSGYGFYLDGRTSVMIQNVTVKDWEDGLRTRKSVEITITENRITGNTIGVTIYDSSDYNSVYSNNITDNGIGVVVEYSDYNNIFDNNVTDNADGFWIGAYSGNNTLTDNNVENNSRYGIMLYVTGDNELQRNALVNNTYNFEVDGAEVNPQLWQFVNDVDRTNTVDGKPIYYWVSKQSGTIPADAGYVALVNCTNIIVENLNLTRNGKSIQLAWTEKSEITGNNITDSDYGIWLLGSDSNNITQNNLENNDFQGIWIKSGSYNLVSENTVKNNKAGIMFYETPLNTISRNNIKNNKDYGVRIHTSSSNKITDNNITQNGPNAYGIWIFYCSYNNISGNNIDGNSYGIYLQGTPTTDCKNNSITLNNLSNGGYGIYLWYAFNNTVHHNYFIENTVHAYLSPSKGNFWDDGYPSGGNFWSGYYDVDSFSGSNQDASGSDGIWDNPYVIDSNNEDRYPFAPPSYTLIVDPAIGGTTDPPTGSYTYYDGQIATILAIPDVNYTFDHWEYGSQTNTDNPMSVTMNQDHTVLPVFYESPHPPPVPEFPIGLALEASFIPVFIYLLWRRKQGRTPSR